MTTYATVADLATRPCIEIPRLALLAASYLAMPNAWQTANKLWIYIIGHGFEVIRRALPNSIIVSQSSPARTHHGVMFNKWRALQMLPEYGAFCLVDTDVVLLRPPMFPFSVGRIVSARIAGTPKVTAARWREFYRQLSITVPEERFVATSWLCGTPSARSNYAADASAMFPYFNGGVLFGDSPRILLKLWQEMQRSIQRLCDVRIDLRDEVVGNDQVSLSLLLVKAGQHTFQPLSFNNNADLRMLATGLVSAPDACIVHLHGIFSSYGRECVAHSDPGSCIEESVFSQLRAQHTSKPLTVSGGDIISRGIRERFGLLLREFTTLLSGSSAPKMTWQTNSAASSVKF